MVIFKFHYEPFVSKMTRSLSYKSLSIGGNQRDTLQGTLERRQYNILYELFL
jgi:hypothetical protein